MRVPRARTLLVIGAALLALDVALLPLFAHGRRAGAPAAKRPSPPATTTAAAATTTPAPAPPPTPTTSQPAPAPAPPPPAVPMSWSAGGAILWHADYTDPEWLGRTLRRDGFGWAAVVFGTNGRQTPTDAGWIARFRLASGLPVGGWSSLGDDPTSDAALAVRWIRRDHLAFWIADAEAPYDSAGLSDADHLARRQRSHAYVSAFRAAEPSLPAALSSYCVAGGLDLAAWAQAGFDFLPQAYVNDFGGQVAPARCAQAATPFFPRSRVHPTVASYPGRHGFFAPARFARLLAAAGTTGFSVYPAEAGMTTEDWDAYGRAIASLHIAARPG